MGMKNLWRCLFSRFLRRVNYFLIWKDIFGVSNRPTINFKFESIIFIKIIKLAWVVALNRIMVKISVWIWLASFVESWLGDVYYTFIKTFLITIKSCVSSSTITNFIFCWNDVTIHAFFKIWQSRYIIVRFQFNSKFCTVLVLLIADVIILFNIFKLCSIHTLMGPFRINFI